MSAQPSISSDSIASIPSSPESRWPRRIVPIALLWATCLVVLIGLQNGAKPEDRAQALAIAASGFYTLLLFSTRRWWLPRLARHPLRNAIASGVLSAALVETLFLVAEKITGASGVAADPNLAMDLLITMPWYFGMVATFVRVQRVRRFPTEVVLLLGGIYEACVDGFLGGVFGGAILNPAFFLVIPTVWIWLFIPVYSSILLPPAWITATDARPVASGRPRVRFRRWLAPNLSGAAWRDALRPLLWVIPFALYLLVVIAIVSILK